MTYDHIARKLATGAIIIIDGGTGTDLQRRGAAMSGDSWCADANLTHPAIVREVHADSVWATEAAIATGVPVWVGISVEKNNDGVLTGFGREDMRLDDVARALAAVRPAVVSIMHTSPGDTDEAIAVVREHWKGPLGAYPESGYFRMPEWTFVDIIPPKELVDRAWGWRARGVSIFGGCCGLGPEHIEALHKEFTP